MQPAAVFFRLKAMNNAQIGFFIALTLIAVVFQIAWIRAARRVPGGNTPRPIDFGVAFVTCFLDTLHRLGSWKTRRGR